MAGGGPQEAKPGRVRVALVYYSLPGVEATTITAADLAAGDRLTLAPPDDRDDWVAPLAVRDKR